MSIGGNTHSPKKFFFDTERSKDKHFKVQRIIVLKAFSKYPKTMLQVSKETGIYRANICRYISGFKKRNTIKLIRFGICPISKHRAGFYYTGKEGGNG